MEEGVIPLCSVLSALSDMGQSSSDLRALEACCAERSRTLRMDSPVSRPAGPLKGQVVSFDCVEDIAVSEDVLHAVQRDNQSEQMSSPNSSQLTDTTVSITPPSNQGTHSASRLPVSPELVFGASHLKIQESARWNKRELRTGESPKLAAAVELSDKSQGNGGNAATVSSAGSMSAATGVSESNPAACKGRAKIRTLLFPSLFGRNTSIFKTPMRPRGLPKNVRLKRNATRK